MLYISLCQLQFSLFVCTRDQIVYIIIIHVCKSNVNDVVGDVSH
jgi:hypothetical protein